MPQHGQTGLVIPVPAVDPVLAAVAARFPGAVRDGVPAHVSVLYPFVPADELGGGVVAELAEMFVGQPEIPVSFPAARRDGGFVSLRPEPAAAVSALTAAAQQRRPGLLPYDNRYGPAQPHVTVAMRTPQEDAMTIQRELADQLPITTVLTEAWLVAFTGRWAVHTRFPFHRAV